MVKYDLEYLKTKLNDHSKILIYLCNMSGISQSKFIEYAKYFEDIQYFIIFISNMTYEVVGSENSDILKVIYPNWANKMSMMEFKYLLGDLDYFNLHCSEFIKFQVLFIYYNSHF